MFLKAMDFELCFFGMFPGLFSGFIHARVAVNAVEEPFCDGRSPNFPAASLRPCRSSNITISKISRLLLSVDCRMEAKNDEKLLRRRGESGNGEEKNLAMWRSPESTLVQCATATDSVSMSAPRRSSCFCHLVAEGWPTSEEP
jgi:hypothetical protein